MSEVSQSPEVFISYSPADKEYLSELQKHLQMLRREGVVTTWTDEGIADGEDWQDKIKAELNKADVILLLVSPDYLASDYCYQEAVAAMKRHKSHDAFVMPILVRPVDWRYSPFGTIDPLPRNGRPLTQWSDRDQALSEVAKSIRNVIVDLSAGKSLRDLDSTKNEILNHLRRHKSIPFIELESVSSASTEDLHDALELLARDDYVYISSPEKITDSIISARRKALVPATA